MRLQLYNIALKLQPYIRSICTMDCDEGVDTSHIRVLPDTCVELFINYTATPLAIIDDQLFSHSIINSRMSKHMDVKLRKGSGCLAVCFHPGMAYHFLPSPMHLLTNTTVQLQDVWKNMSTAIEDELAYKTNNIQRAEAVQQYLLAQLANSKEDKLVTHSLQLIALASSPLSVRQLTEHVGVSQRQLSRRFQQCIGLSPKAYLRADRFIRSLQHLKKHPNLSLTDVAYESGYYDQAHFIHDYHFYTGYTPGEIIQLKHVLY